MDHGRGQVRGAHCAFGVPDTKDDQISLLFLGCLENFLRWNTMGHDGFRFMPEFSVFPSEVAEAALSRCFQFMRANEVTRFGMFDYVKQAEVRAMLLRQRYGIRQSSRGRRIPKVRGKKNLTKLCFPRPICWSVWPHGENRALARRRISSATEPRINLPIPRRPFVPSTIKSAFFWSAIPFDHRQNTAFLDENFAIEP